MRGQSTARQEDQNHIQQTESPFQEEESKLDSQNDLRRREPKCERRADDRLPSAFCAAFFFTSKVIHVRSVTITCFILRFHLKRGPCHSLTLQILRRLLLITYFLCARLTSARIFQHPQ